MFRRSFPLLTLLVVLLGAGASAARLHPTDDTDRVPDFREFATHLRAAVQARDAGFVRSLITDRTDLGFGGRMQPGEASRLLQQFRSTLDRHDAPFWLDMERFMNWGAGWRAQEETMWYPSVFLDSRLTPGDVVIAGADVNVRAAPDRGAPVVARLTWELFKNQSRSARTEWSALRLPDGRTGYVHNAFIYAGGDPRVGFSRSGGRWILRWYSGGC